VPAVQVINMSQLNDTSLSGDQVPVIRKDGKLSVCLEPATATGAGVADLPPRADVRPSSVNDCKRIAEQWPETRGRPYSVPVLFNSKGLHCYSPPVVRVGDLLVVGMVLEANESVPADASVDFANCPQESATPAILANGDFPRLEAGELVSRREVVYLDARACGSESPAVSVRIGSGENAVSNPYTLSQYKRYRATFHMGAVYTDLHDTKFGLRDADGTNVIFNSEPVKRGPEYVAALVVQGVGHYFENLRSRGDPNDTRNWPYKGRDPIHDGAFLDKLGFVMSAGIEHPGDRFGVGLSYEVAYGINIVGLYEMAKVKQLRGFEIGDPFTGAADTIPTGKEWESKFSVGLTFDLAYATKLFTGAKSGG